MAARQSDQGPAGNGEQKLRDAAKALADAAGQLGQSLGVAGASAETGVTKGLLAAAQALAQATAWVEQRAKPLSTREQLMEQAARLFAERGFSGVSLEDIAQAAGFTKGAVYSHFGSKEQVFLAAVRNTIERIEAGLAVLDAGGDAAGLTEAAEGAAPSAVGGVGAPLSSQLSRAGLSAAATLGVEALLFGKRVPEHRAEVRELSAALIAVLARADEGLQDEGLRGSEEPSDERVLARDEAQYAVLALRALLAGIAEPAA